MITMNLYYQMKEGKKEEFIKTIYSLGIPQATQKEEGCIAYNCYVSPDKDEILLIEKWESEDCLPSHTQQEHFKKLISLKADYVISTNCEKFE